MGCTSSAQNMPPSLTNSEKELKFSEETDEMVEEDKPVIVEKGNESNGIQVLPSCDNLGESTHLDRNKSLVDMMNPDLDKVTQEKESVLDNEHENRNINEATTDHSNKVSIESSQSDEKLSTLEEVVEKVVELYVENPSESKPAEPSEEAHEKEEDAKHHDAKQKQDDETETKEAEEEVGEQAASPSQSQSSRATRWEALADIAAELPPSLAVDPITGQIYSLSK